MFKKILLLLTSLLIIFSLSACSGNSANNADDGNSVSDEAAEVADWKQNVAPDFGKKTESKYSVGKQEAYNGKKYNMTMASFNNCTEADFDSYKKSLEKAGFKLNSESSTEDIEYYFDAAGNMVVIGLSNGYFSITVGTPAK